MTTDVAKTLMIVGALLLGGGIVLFFFGKIPWMGRLPGDLVIKKENFSFYFPLTTCILLSLLVTLILQLFHRR